MFKCPGKMKSSTFSMKTVKQLFSKGIDLLINPAKLPIVTYLILFCELILNVFIVNRINYTEIDWVAYMQECEGFLNGTTNYAELKGEKIT